MNYTYTVGVKLATPNSNFSFLEDKYNHIIMKYIETFNDISTRSANPKTATIVNIYRDYFVLRIDSVYEISAVGKALRPFSKLIVDSHEFDDYIKYSKLFSTFPLINVSNISEDIVDPETIISDAELIKGLVDYTCSKTENDYKRKKIAMTKIKKIALEAGIVQI